MNLEKLFNMQKVLRDRINYNGDDRFNKLILALLVELGECANEWRGFKFWSENQAPRVNAARAPYMDLDDADFYNPLLEEYVDGLHFVLDLGIEKGFVIDIHKTKIKSQTVTEQFNKLFKRISVFGENPILFNYDWILDLFIGLGEMLGFTWEQIVQAYMDKNKINHVRQENGY